MNVSWLYVVFNVSPATHEIVFLFQVYQGIQSDVNEKIRNFTSEIVAYTLLHFTIHFVNWILVQREDEGREDQ